MGNLFAKKKISRVTNHDRAVLQMKQQRDRLKQYQLRIEQSLEAERLLAKKLLNDGKRDRAKLLLRKKRFQEQLLQRADGQLENMERLIQDLEFSVIETQVFEGLKVGNEALKKMNEMISIDQVERIMDETREAIEKQKEIDELLTGVLTAEDEEAVEDEFNALIGIEEEQNISNKLPQVPSDQLPETVVSQKEGEDNEVEMEKVVAEKKPKRVAVVAE